MLLYTTVEKLSRFSWVIDIWNQELLEIITNATNIIDSYIKRNLEKYNITEHLDWFWHKKIYLKNIPNNILSIKSKCGNISYNLDYFDWYIAYTKECLPKWKKNIIVEYEIWFTTVPAEIENICLDLCLFLLKQAWKTSDNMENITWNLIKSKQLWDLSISYFSNNEKNNNNSFEKLNPAKNIEIILNKYKKFSWII